MSRQEKNDIFKTLAFLEVGIWVVSILYKAVKIFFLPPNIKNIATSIPEYDSPKDAKYLGCLKTICKVLAWFIGGFSVIVVHLGSNRYSACRTSLERCQKNCYSDY